MRGIAVASRRGASRPVPEQKSKAVPELVDPRVEKTRMALTAAFFGLMSRRAYGQIRVSDIVRKAGVGRATFYGHFSSKDDLLRSELDRIVLPMVIELPNEPFLVECTPLFAHVQRARAVYRSLTAGPSRSATERMVQDALEVRVSAIFTQRRAERADGAALPAFAARFVASTLLTLIAWSLEQADPPAPAELQQTFQALVGGALGSSAKS